jgi:hypothetical protein
MQLGNLSQIVVGNLTNTNLTPIVEKTEWTPWSDCSAACGVNGTRSRTKICGKNRISAPTLEEVESNSEEGTKRDKRQTERESSETPEVVLLYLQQELRQQSELSGIPEGELLKRQLELGHLSGIPEGVILKLQQHSESSVMPEGELLQLHQAIRHYFENPAPEGSQIPGVILLKLQQLLAGLPLKIQQLGQQSGIPEGKLLKLQQQLRQHLENHATDASEILAGLPLKIQQLGQQNSIPERKLLKLQQQLRKHLEDLENLATDASGTPGEDFLKLILQLEHLENRTTDESGIPDGDLLKLQQQLEQLETSTTDLSRIKEGDLLKLQQQLRKHLEPMENAPAWSRMENRTPQCPSETESCAAAEDDCLLGTVGFLYLIGPSRALVSCS